MGSIHKLSAAKVHKLSQAGRYGDGGGLWLQVSPWQTKSWLFQFTARNGRVRQFGLGPLHTVSLAKARELAQAAREAVRNGIDPIEARRAQRAQERVAHASILTFKHCADQYIAAHEASWRHPKHRIQWVNSLNNYAAPIAQLPITAIDTPLVLKVLEPIWVSKPPTAERLRGRIERVLDFAQARGYRTGENPARWRGHLDKLLPAPSKVRQVKHYAALPYADMGAFMAALRMRDDIIARAVEVTILTASRTAEVLGAKWSEVDLANKVWTIPGPRIKGGKEHRIPLTDSVIEILNALPREAGNDHVFFGTRAARRSQRAMLTLVQELRAGMTVHGFRSTFRDWAAETTNYPNHVVEMALAHQILNKVEAAYRRGDLLDKRRRLMNEWARFCDKPLRSASVTPIRGQVS
jgi:integrase